MLKLLYFYSGWLFRRENERQVRADAKLRGRDTQLQPRAILLDLRDAKRHKRAPRRDQRREHMRNANVQREASQLAEQPSRLHIERSAGQSDRLVSAVCGQEQPAYGANQRRIG